MKKSEIISKIQHKGNLSDMLGLKTEQDINNAFGLNSTEKCRQEVKTEMERLNIPKIGSMSDLI